MTQKEFQLLFDKYFDDVRRYVLYRSGNEALATDIAQDTFMRIWEKQMKIDHKTVKSLLFKIASNMFVSAIRREKVAFNFMQTFKPNELGQSPEEELSYKQLTQAYEKALKTMPEKQRTVFLMSRIEELKYQEIADQLGLSVKAIEKRMTQALEHLRLQLKSFYGKVVLFIMTMGKRIKN